MPNTSPEIKNVEENSTMIVWNKPSCSGFNDNITYLVTEKCYNCENKPIEVSEATYTAGEKIESLVIEARNTCNETILLEHIDLKQKQGKNYLNVKSAYKLLLWGVICVKNYCGTHCI